MKKADNFNASKWLVENKITFQSKLVEAKGQDPSKSGEEFSLSCKIVQLSGAEYVNYNFKLDDVDFEEVKRGTGILSKVGSFIKGKPTIQFYFKPVSIEGLSKSEIEEIKDVFITVKLKNDAFVLDTWNTSEITAASIPDSTQATKFINYLLGKSQWKDGLNNTFGDMKTKLTPASFKK
jgi:hypothetical protein